MSKKEAKIEATPAPQSPSHEEETPPPNGPAVPKSWGWLRPEEVEPADAAQFDNATFDNARWAP